MKTILLFCSFLVLTFYTNAQPVWQWQNPNMPMSNLNSISMIDTTEGWVTVGTNSLLHYTGGQWDTYTVPSLFTMVNPTNVFFLSHSLGWVGCNNGIFRYNGITWQKIIGIDSVVKDMVFLNQNKGWALAGGQVYGINNLNAAVDTLLPDLNAICIPDSLHGWAVGDSGIVMSYYGGVWYNWPPITSNDLHDVYFTDLNHGWAVGENGTILFFNGTGWQVQNSGVSFNLLALDFADPTHGFAGGFGDTVISCNGTSWSFFSTSDSYVLSIDMVTPDRGFASCYMGIILNIIDTTLSSYPTVDVTNNELMGMSFVDKDHGWAVGRNGTMLTYLFGTWTCLDPIITNADLNAVDFPDIEHGWCVGQYGVIEEYSNGNWYGQFLDSAMNLYSVHFVDSLNGWAVGQDGVILHYHNNEWIQEVSNTDTTLLSVHFTDTANGWAVGTYGVRLHYVNGVWYNMSDANHLWLSSVFLNSANDGWAVGDSGKIMHYNGIDWQVHTTVPFASWKILQSVYFEAPDNGWIVGMQSLYHYDGNQWTDYSYTLPTAFQYYSICFPDEGNGWISGGYGNINYCKNPSTVVTNTTEIPKTRKLYDIYPNPCETNCFFNIDNKDHETINVSIFGLSGLKYFINYTIENNVVVIDVTKLETGMYFLIIETDSDKVIRKIIKK